MNELLFYSLLGGFFSLFGGFILLWKPLLTKKILLPLIAFGAGAFLAAALLDILPEALEGVSQPHPILISVLVGFSSFFILERALMRYFQKPHKETEHAAHRESLPFLLILGDGVHNFFDGIIIAIAYIANPALGLPTALAIAAHEIPQEIGDFSILLELKWDRWKIVLVNVLQSLITIPGVFLGIYMGQIIEPYLPWFLGATAGIFLYIAASDIIPELHHQSGHTYFLRVIAPFVASIVFLWFVITFIGGH